MVRLQPSLLKSESAHSRVQLCEAHGWRVVLSAMLWSWMGRELRLNVGEIDPKSVD
jgi:hypothetical protein